MHRNNYSSRRVVITGLGTINPLGNDVKTSWNNLLIGARVVKPLESFDTSRYLTKIGAQIANFDINNYLHLVSKKDARRMDPSSLYALVAANEAMNAANLHIVSNEQGDRYGNIIGTGIGGLTVIYNARKKLMERGPMRVSPFTSTHMLPNTPSGVVGLRFNLRGISYALVSACATGTHVIGEGMEVIRRGDADVMVVGGTEAPFTPLGMAAFHRTSAMSTRNDDPTHASRPFDRDRDGFVISEGAACLVLESFDHAQERGALILAEVVGYGASTDAYHLSAPPEGGEGAARSMRMALRKAGLTPNQIDYINAHGTSTILNDMAETAAIKSVFGEYAYQLPVSSTKSMSGHMLGAAGAFEGVIAAKVIQEGKIPPTINLFNPDIERGCDLDYVPHVMREQSVRTVMSNSFGFGGHNATIILKVFEE